ncbi:hypothetical protein FKM82_000198 [Ascaphus truei]
MAARRGLGKLIKRDVLVPTYRALPAETGLSPESPTPSSLYPPVVASLTAKSKAAQRRRAEVFYNRAHAASTARERLQILTALQRLKYVVYPQTFSLHADRWYQHFTKTAYVSGLPERRGGGGGDTGAAELPERRDAGGNAAGLPERRDAAGLPERRDAGGAAGRASLGAPGLSELRSQVCELLLQEYFYAKKGRSYLYKQQEFSVAPFLTQLVSLLNSQCAAYNPLLAQSCLDLKPQVNFYWMRGEVRVPRGRRKGRIDPIRFQIDDKPLAQIRVCKQLPEFVPLDYTVPEEVPVITYEPSRLPLFRRQYDNNIFIGTKIEDPCNFGHTQFHLVPDKFKRERLIKANLADQIEVRLRANAIASLFAWTGAQAMYQGFWSHADLTRPFVSQGVISDGKYFSFFCYQLNTLALTVETDNSDCRKNICWGTQSIPLFDAVEEDNIKGFNDEVLKQLVDFFLNYAE